MSFSDNPFALLDDDAPAAPRGPAAVKQVQQQQAQKPAVAPSRPAAGDNRGENNAAARGGNKSRRGGRGGNSNVARSSNENIPVGGHESHPRGTRPRRGRRGGWHGHGREFDRHSGMLPDSDKKVKQGWGDPTNVAEETTNGETVTPGEFAGENADANNNAEAPEEVEVVKTLEEYLAEKASLKSTKTSASIRKPNEGVDESKWKGAVPLERKEEEDPLFAGKQNKDAGKAGAKKQTKSKQFVDIEQRFNDSGSASGRGGRGPRGSTQRQGSSGRGRGGRAPNLNDTSAFPVLA